MFDNRSAFWPTFAGVVLIVLIGILLKTFGAL